MNSGIFEDTYNYIFCRECGLKCKQVSGKHLAKHNMTAAEYKIKYPMAPLMCQESENERSKNISKALIGKPAYNKGKPMSEEQKKKQSEAMKGKQTRKGAVLSEETKRKISKSLTGKKLSSEHKQALKDSIARRKKNGTYVHPLTNYVMTDEHRRKSTEALLAANERKSINSEIALIETIKQYNLQFIKKRGRRWTVLCTICNNQMTYDKQIFRPSKKPDRACPVCFPRMSGTSYGEIEMSNYIKSLTINDVFVNNYDVVAGFEVDAYIPEQSLAFEFNGLYWHSANVVDKRLPFHISNKLKYAYKNGIELTNIFSDEWEYRNGAVKDLIRRTMNVDGEKIEEKAYTIREVKYDDSLEDFIINNSVLLDGYDGKIYICALNDDTIISVGIFDKMKDDKYKLIDLIIENDKDIDNGDKNILNQFINNYNPQSIIWKTNNCYWVNGMIARTLGFKMIKQEKTIPWLTKDYKSRIHPNTFPDKSLDELRESGYDWIYDCGYSVWELNL